VYSGSKVIAKEPNISRLSLPLFGIPQAFVSDEDTRKGGLMLHQIRYLFVLIFLSGALSAGEATRDADLPQVLPTLHTGDGVDMLLIPAGTCVITEISSQRTLQITKPFLLARCEVSQALWRSLMHAEPSWLQGDNLPVEWVSWESCQEFLKRLSQRDGMTYRLPTQVEWEYACRTGSNDKHGDGTRDSYVHTRELTPIDECPANAWGLRGMNGNVWEWCADILPEGNHAMRGGSCNLYPVWCPANEYLSYPANFKHERRGLRLAADVINK
jgi:formylglycine-generating enzyme required for sulfatase activity